MAKTAFIGIGSNLGDKLSNCLKSIELIRRLPDSRLEATSDFFRSEPVGVEGQDWYANGAVSLKTELSAREPSARFAQSCVPDRASPHSMFVSSSQPPPHFRPQAPYTIVTV